MAGIVVPYGGWFATARRSYLVKLADKVSKIEKSPFLSGAAKEAVMLTPFEVGRVGVSQVLPWADESAMDIISPAPCLISRWVVVWEGRFIASPRREAGCENAKTRLSDPSAPRRYNYAE